METITPDPSNISEELKALVQGNTSFALQLYQQLRAGKGNLFFSPAGLSLALAMAYAGARGQTEAQMSSVLGFNLGGSIAREIVSNPGQLHASLAELQRHLNRLADQKTQLYLANSIWPQAGYPILESYLEITRTHYQAQPTDVDYIAAAEEARLLINDWVSTRTHGKITDLITPGLLDSLTRLVLVSALYFKGEWMVPFDARSTQEAPFTTATGNAVPVQMMHLTGLFNYAQLDQIQILEAPYEGNDLAMLVFLPDQVDGLPELERLLPEPGRLERWLASLDRTNVQVNLPRFKLTNSLRLDPFLKQMGMTDAFNPDQADFSGVDGRVSWLYIHAVLSKAFIEVNEEGSEAAAAAAVIIRQRSAISRPPTFSADHPFLFMIRERQTGSILFLGRLCEP